MENSSDGNPKQSVLEHQFIKLCYQGKYKKADQLLKTKNLFKTGRCQDTKLIYSVISSGYLKTLKILMKIKYFQNNITRYDIEHKLLIKACVNGHFRILKWFYYNYSFVKNISSSALYQILICCIENKKIKILKWIIYKFSILTNEIKLRQIISSAAYLGNKSFLIWLEKKIDGLGKFINDDLGSTVALYGKLDMLRWLYQKYNINLNYDNDFAFTISCTYGYLNQAKWIYNNSNVDLLANNSEPFSSAAEEGHLKIVKWLYGLESNKDKFNFDKAFSYACAKNKIKVSKWILGKRQLNNTVLPSIFSHCSMVGNEKICRWLITLGVKPNIDCIIQKIYYPYYKKYQLKKLKSIIVLACFYNKVIKIWKEYLYNGNNGLLIPILKTNFESKTR